MSDSANFIKYSPSEIKGRNSFSITIPRNIAEEGGPREQSIFITNKYDYGVEPIEIIFKQEFKKIDTPVESIKCVSPEDGHCTIEIGQSIILEVKVIPEDATEQGLRWYFDGGQVQLRYDEIIGNTAKITGMNVGNARAFAQSLENEGKEAVFQITVIKPKIHVNYIDYYNDQKVFNINTGTGVSQLGVEVYPLDADNKKINWSIIEGSSYFKLLDPEQHGLFCAIQGTKAGSGKVLAVSDDNPDASLEFIINVEGKPAIHVTDIETTHALEFEMTPKESDTITVNVLPSNADNKAINWSITSGSDFLSISRSENKCTITAGSKEGYAEILAVSDDNNEKKILFKVTIKERYVPVTGIETASPKDINLVVGGTVVVGARIVPYNATNQKIKWEVEWDEKEDHYFEYNVNESDNSCTITAVGYGENKILYAISDEDENIRESFNVSVINQEIPLNSIEYVYPKDGKCTLAIGESIILEAQVNPEYTTYQGLYWHGNGGFTSFKFDPDWIGTDGKIRGKKCRIIGVREGNDRAIVDSTEKIYEGKSLIFQITVVKPTVKHVTDVNPRISELSFYVGGQARLEVEVLPLDADNKAIKWSTDSTDDSFKILNSKDNICLVGGSKRGTWHVYATSVDGNITGTITVNIMERSTEIIPVESVTPIGMDMISMYVGQSRQLLVNVLPSNATDKKIIWEVKGNGEIEINDSGFITGLKKGTCEVNAISHYDSNIKAVFAINVEEQYIKVKSLTTLFAKNIVLEKGNTQLVTVLVNPNNANNKNVIWSVKSGKINVSISSIDNACIITANEKGTAIVQAVSEDNSEAKVIFNVTVKEKTEPLVPSETCLSYYSTDDNIVEPYDIEAFDGNLVSNEYGGKGDLCFDDSVSFIQSNAMMKSDTLSDVICPSKLHHIGYYVFANDKNLTNIEFPETLKHVQGSVMTDNDMLTDVTLQEGLEYIGEWMFYRCISLESIKIPKSVESINREAFKGCISLSRIEYAGTVEEWKNIKKYYDWNKDILAAEVICSDGNVEL